MWSWIALGMTAWFAVAVMICLAIARAVRLRDLFGAAPVPVADSHGGVAHPDPAFARAHARS